MLAVLRQRNFGLLWTGQVISMIGDWVLFVVLPFYIYAITGSALATGIMFIVQTLPQLFFSSVAGVFVDRWNRKHTMVIVSLVQALILVPLFLVHSPDMIWVIYVSGCASSLASQFFVPAQTSIIPMLVDEKNLISANSLNSMSQELTRLIGPSLGGLLFGLLGVGSVIALDVISFLLSAVLIALVVVPARPARTMQEEVQAQPARGVIKSLSSVWQEWRVGMSLVKKEQLVSAIFILIGISMVGEGIIQVLIAPYVVHILHGTSLVLGWLMSAQAIGGILGSLAIPRLSKIIPPGRLMGACGLTFGGLVAVIALFPFMPGILFLMIIIGVGAVGFFIPMLTLLQMNVANEYQGRIFGSLTGVQAMAMLIGMAMASGLGDRLGIVPMMIVDAGFNVLAALLAFVLVRASLPVAAPVVETELAEELAVGEKLSAHTEPALSLAQKGDDR